MVRIRDKTFSRCFQLSFLLLTAQIVILAFFWQKLPPQVPLFYSRPWGEEQLVSPLVLLFLPITSLLVILTNSIMASLITREGKLASQFLVIFGTVFNFLCLVTLFKIVTLVI